jgi:hypothetical protein
VAVAVNERFDELATSAACPSSPREMLKSAFSPPLPIFFFIILFLHHAQKSRRQQMEGE